MVSMLCLLEGNFRSTSSGNDALFLVHPITGVERKLGNK